MGRSKTTTALRVCLTGLLLVCSAGAGLASAKQRRNRVSPNDPTARLFELLDNSYGGRLADFCVVANTYAKPSHPGQTLQYVLQVSYDKSLFYGRLSISVRGVSQLTAGQLAEYTPQEIYGFGSNVARFEKINPGPLGEVGDSYFRATSQGVLASAPVTKGAIRQYDSFLNRYIMPALEKG